MYPVFYMPIDHRAGDIGTGMIYQIIGTLGDDLLIMSDVLSIESSIRDINPSIMYALRYPSFHLSGKLCLAAFETA